MSDRTASGLTRRTTQRPYPVAPDGSIVWPQHLSAHWRRVLITGTHRRADGSHYNVVADRVCTGCVLESELEYLRACWRAALPAPRRWWT